MKKSARPPAETPVQRELRAQRNLLQAMLGQLTLAMETLTVMRADQLRILSQQGQAPQNMPDLHRCSDPEHTHAEVKHAAPRSRARNNRK